MSRLTQWNINFFEKEALQINEHGLTSRIGFGVCILLQSTLDTSCSRISFSNSFTFPFNPSFSTTGINIRFSLVFLSSLSLSSLNCSNLFNFSLILLLFTSLTLEPLVSNWLKPSLDESLLFRFFSSYTERLCPDSSFHFLTYSSLSTTLSFATRSSSSIKSLFFCWSSLTRSWPLGDPDSDSVSSSCRG